MKKRKTLVIAHRGNTEKHLENTLPAFEAALKSKVDGVELDLQITTDGTIIVFHDKDLKRLSDIKKGDKKIEHMSFSEIKKVKLHGGYKIPTLDEFLDLMGSKLLINLELKTHHYLNGSLEEALSKKLKQYKYSDELILSSFNPLSLIRMKVLCPKIKRGYLFEDKFLLHYHLLLPMPKCYSIHSPLKEMTPQKVLNTHNSGKKFFVWTVNDENDMRACLEAGVDGIITDQPSRLQRILK